MTHDEKGILPSRTGEAKKPSRWQRRFLGAVCVLAGVILLALLGIHGCHPKMLYRPEAVPTSESAYFAQYPNLNVEPKWLVTPDGVRLRAYWFPSSKTGQPVLYFLYGSDGNMGNAVEYISRAKEHFGWNIFLLAYRGYGFSEGRPSMSGIQTDVGTGLKHLRTEMSFDRDQIIVYGHSFGGAVALHLAARQPSSFGTLIVESTFSSVRDMGSRLFPRWAWLTFVVTENWDNKIKVDELIQRATKGERMPRILMISVGHDQMLPQMRGLENQLNAMPSSTLVQRLHLPNGTHYGFLDPNYFASLTRCAASNKPDCS